MYKLTSSPIPYSRSRSAPLACVTSSACPMICHCTSICHEFNFYYTHRSIVILRIRGCRRKWTNERAERMDERAELLNRRHELIRLAFVMSGSQSSFLCKCERSMMAFITSCQYGAVVLQLTISPRCGENTAYIERSSFETAEQQAPRRGPYDQKQLDAAQAADEQISHAVSGHVCLYARACSACT